MPYIMFTMSRNFLVNYARQFFITVDGIIYTAISLLMQTIFDVSNFTLDPALFGKITDKIYLLLSIFMLFKLTISLLSYLVNPDKVSDKEKGAGKVITRTILVLIMLLILPSGFKLLGDVQEALIPSIPRIVLGKPKISMNEIGNTGSRISWQLFQAYFYRNAGCSIADSGDATNFLTASLYINQACDNPDIDYQYDYSFGLSTLTGGFMVYVLLGIAISVAIRLFKLLILQMIAPIPIISYIDPKSSKDGAFNTWLKAVGSTWVELFIQLGILYLIIFIVNDLVFGTLGNIASYAKGLGVLRGLFFLVFIILGLFMFAKQAPKFITDSLGIKSKGTFARVMGMSAATIGGIGSTRAAYRARNEYDADNNRGSHRIRNMGASLFSGLVGAAAGGQAVLSSDKPTLSTGFDAQTKYNATALSRINAGSTLPGRIGAVGQTLIAGETTADRNERRIKAMEEFNKALGAIGSRAKDEMVKQEWTESIIGKKDVNGNWQYFMQDISGQDVTGAINYKDFIARKKAAIAAGQSQFQIHTTKGDVTINMADAERYEGLLLKGNESNYIERTITGGDHEDKYMVALEQDANAKSTIAGFKVTDRDSVKQTADELGIQITQMQRDNARHIANRRGQGNKGN